MDFAGLCGKEDLTRLDADIYALDAAEAQVAARSVEHDGAAGIDHMCLEEHFVDMAIVVDDVQFAWRKVEPPVAEVAIHDVDGVVLEGAVEPRTFEDFA